MKHSDQHMSLEKRPLASSIGTLDSQSFSYILRFCHVGLHPVSVLPCFLPDGF